MFLMSAGQGLFEILVLVLGCLVLYQWVLVFCIAPVGVVSQLVLDVWHAPVGVVSADREKSCLCVWFCKSTGSFKRLQSVYCSYWYQLMFGVLLILVLSCDLQIFMYFVH